MVEKEHNIYCSYCGSFLVQTTTLLMEKIAHIQHFSILGACDQCSKSFKVDFSGEDFKPEIEKPFNCISCGGQINASTGICAACTATGFNQVTINGQSV